MKPRTSRLTRSKRGAALPITLLMGGLLLFLIVAYMASMKTERSAATTYLDTQSAKLLSQSALSHAIELLRTNIPEPARLEETAESAPVRQWIVNPGRLTVFEESGEPRHVDLHTGAVTENPDDEATRDALSVDLNQPLPIDQKPPICVALDERGNPDPNAPRPEMRILWKTVLEDPSQDASATNRMIGRYAFWMDDESGKINFNVAAGKTARGVVDTERFHEQYKTGLMPALFTLGRSPTEFNKNSTEREWALGQPRSINTNVLVDRPEHLDTLGMLEHAWLQGFSRYPEAILDFARMEEPLEWYHQQKYNLTFYSRSPEFNAFGKPRLFTTNIPLSLESGPLYQLPFVYGEELKKPMDGVLHLHSLMGSLGFTHQFKDPNGRGNIHASNVINEAQLAMLMGYMRRKWPGYDRSFVDKYGEAECYQMAISMLLMARVGTTEMNDNTASGGGSRDWAWRTTSVNFSPGSKEMPGETPERHYWRVPTSSGEVLMIPQTPGPHITEVRFQFELENAPPPTEGESGNFYRVRYRYESEYYMHPYGPVVLLNHFPTKVDYLWLEVKADKTTTQELGPAKGGTKDADRNWNDGASLGKLQAWAGGGVKIGPSNGEQNRKTGEPKVPYRKVVRSPFCYVGEEDGVVPDKEQAAIFKLNSGSPLDITFKIRMGMGVKPDDRRPRQMIPLGETSSDVLEGEVQLDDFERSKGIGWYIDDPRLSAHKDEWKMVEDDDDPNDDQGTTIGNANPDELEETSSEKSKFRYVARGTGKIQSVNSKRSFNMNRPDEFNSRSRVSSIGFWSVLHTGIQNKAAWRTLNLGPESTPNEVPDGVLLDLLGATYPMQHDQWKIDSTLPDSFSTVSYMHSTAGQVNLNTKAYPESEWFQAPQRKKPLEAVFKHLRPDPQIERLVDGITSYQETGKAFQYIGELTQVDGYELGSGAKSFTNPNGDPTQFEQEALLRNMAGCLTTRSNTFGIWGVAQVVRKSRESTKFDEFEAGDGVMAEKRFFAIIERYLWPGTDGVPGNAHVDSEGMWDRRAKQKGEIPLELENEQVVDRLFSLPGSPPQKKGGGHRLQLDLSGTYPEYDGPEPVGMDPYTQRALGKVVWKESPLEEAYNPPQPVVKYRVVYFSYLDS